MAYISRNYVAEILSLGADIRSVAKALRVSKKQVTGWQIGMSRPPKNLYEPIRNIARRTTYQYLRKAGFPSFKASSFRRLPHPEAVADVSWFDLIINTLYKDWNSRYLAYKANPAGWIAAHPNAKIPRETSRDEIKRRIEKGIRRGKSKEEIENY